MTLVKWNSKNSIPMLSDWDRLFNSVFGEMRSSTQDWIPSVDIHEDEKAWTIDMDLPGLTKKDVSVKVRDHVLTVSGKRETKTENIFRSERIAGAFSRSFNLPEEVNVDKIDGNFNNGVLTVTILRVKPVKKQNEIEVKIN